MLPCPGLVVLLPFWPLVYSHMSVCRHAIQKKRTGGVLTLGVSLAGFSEP